jgi:hypothetical protein
VKREMDEPIPLKYFTFLLEHSPRVKKENDPYLSKSFGVLLVKGEMDE